MATHKEKAIELIDKFIHINGNNFFAKECALLAVDEILLSGTMVGIPNYGNKSGLEYWQEVKSEIEKL